MGIEKLELRQDFDISDGCLMFADVTVIYPGSLTEPDIDDPIVFDIPRLVRISFLRNPLYRTGSDVGSSIFPDTKFVSTNMIALYNENEEGFELIEPEEDLKEFWYMNNNYWIPVGDDFTTNPVVYTGDINHVWTPKNGTRTSRTFHSSRLKHDDLRKRTDMRALIEERRNT